MITTLTGKFGFVTLTAGLVVLVGLLVRVMYRGFSQENLTEAAVGLTAAAGGYLLLTRDPASRAQGWRVVFSAPFGSRRGKWGYFLFLFGLLAVTNVVFAGSAAGVQAPDYTSTLVTAIGAMGLGLGLLLTEQADPMPDP
ncbi:MAG TPA: hypothetical protein VM409_05460 [Chloroflexia bacterium]|nr:hypothetical protein [Chloroflexia bacterium]